jgi:hypothetical protein
MRAVLGLAVAVVLVLPAFAHAARGTNATYFNDAALPAADPYVLHDARSGFYYAYSTDGPTTGTTSGSTARPIW